MSLDRAAKLLRRCLIVEDDKRLQRALGRALLLRGADQVTIAGTVAAGVAALHEHPSLILLDVRLPDGSAQDVVAHARQLRPLPTIVAMSGLASPREAFDLAAAGVGAFLLKPLTDEDLDAVIEKMIVDPPRLADAAAAAVGHGAMPELLRDAREAMIEQALALSDGNRSGAARLLQVSRQAIQQASKPQAPKLQSPKLQSPKLQSPQAVRSQSVRRPGPNGDPE